MEGVATKLFYRATTSWVECGSSLTIFPDVTWHSTRRSFSDKNLTRCNHDRHRGDYIGTPILRVVKHLSRRGRRKRNKMSEVEIVVEEEEESRERNVVVVVGKQQWKYNEAFFFSKRKQVYSLFFITRKYNLFSSMLRAQIQNQKLCQKIWLLEHTFHFNF